MGQSIRNIFAIAQKELRVYFTTWTSWMLLFVFIELVGFFFYLFVSQYQSLSMQYLQFQSMAGLEQLNVVDLVLRPLWSNMGIFFLFMLPVLTMRLFAEERRGRTFELLFTLPVRPIDLVLGKFFGALGVMAAMLALTLTLPLVLQYYMDQGGNSLDWATVGTAYLGLLLLGSAFVAIGCFTSSVTDSQIVAWVLSLFVLLMLWVAGAAGIGQEGGIKEAFEYLSLMNHLDRFTQGLLRSTDVVYFLSLSFAGLFLTHRVVEAQRWR